MRGFVHEVISLFAWIVAIAMLKLFHAQLWTGLINSFHTGSAAAAVLAFAILFLPSFIGVKLYTFFCECFCVARDEQRRAIPPSQLGSEQRGRDNRNTASRGVMHFLRYPR